MLLNFSFSNFKSFREPQQFTMERPASEQKRGGGAVSTVAGVFGANAAGKSSFLDAVRFAKDFVTSDLRIADFLVNRKPFLLDPDSIDEPGGFLFEFAASDGKVYEYEFSVDRQAVLYESLKVKNDKPRARYATLYVREREDECETYRYGASFRGAKKQLEEMTTAGRLFLSTLRRFDVPIARASYEFFDEELSVVPAAAYQDEIPILIGLMKGEGAYGDAISGLLRASGLGIQALEVQDIPNPLLEKCSESEFAAFLATGLKMVQPGLTPEEIAQQAAAMGADVRSASQLLFSHTGKEGIAAKLDTSSESNGTIAGLAFFSLALRVIAHGATLFVDEIDSSLHPLYVRQLVELFKNTETNPTDAQLVFTTHDASLIFNGGAWESVLDEDQIWLVEKDQGGSSELYPLTEVRGARWDEDFGRNYLNGVYGATPIVDLTGAFARALELLGVSSPDAA